MDRDLFNDMVGLLQTDKYSARLKETFKKKKDTFVIDFEDLNSESKKALSTNYSAQTDNIHEEMKMKLNFRAAELKLEERFEDVMIFFQDVDRKRTIRDLTSRDINTLMEINGIVTSIIQPRSILTKAVFQCPSCGEFTYVTQTGTELRTADKCSGCNKKRGLILYETASVWKDYQEFYIQENPEDVAAGVIPRTMKLMVIGKQLVDICKPGDAVNVTVTLVTLPGPKKGRVFNWCLEVNNVDVLNKDAFSADLSDEDVWVLTNWANHPRIRDIIVNSIFPSIYGREIEKLGVTLALFGGVDQERPDVTHRGTIHVLLVGDPSTAKTRMLIAAKNVAPKGIYTSGKGASGVGLTAAAIQDKFGWRLEAGALVLGDQGICCIDEIEKMDENDRSKVHDAMSIQLIRVDRADKHVTLNARTGVIAAGNPAQGRYDEFSTIGDNISLPSTILARFDLIYIITDRPDSEEDRKLMEKILSDASPETPELPLMDREVIKKYILYARTINPVLSEEARKIIIDFYTKMRGYTSEQINNPIAITARQGEALRRLSEAIARIELRKVVEAKDAELATELMMRVLRTARYDPDTEKIDADTTEGKPKGARDKIELVLNALRRAREPIHIDDLVEDLRRFGLTRAKILHILHVDLEHSVHHPHGTDDMWKII